MPFSYARTIHFPETDAAGIVFFARYLSLCHEAYEEALAAAGLPIGRFARDHGVILPVSKSACDYVRSLEAGDKIRIDLTVQSLKPDTYAVHYTMWKLLGAGEKRAAVVRTEHVCIDATLRERQPLPAPLAAWVSAG
jgi:1,4-dihydroxy-2-naphthoyl-CoA hydrolase